MLRVSPDRKTFSVQPRANSTKNRTAPAMTNFKDQTCFVIGGFVLNIGLDNSVSRYNMSRNRWEKANENLNIAR